MIMNNTTAIYVRREHVSLFSPDEWQCIFAHEIAHWVLRQLPQYRNRQWRNFFDELGCDLLSIVALGKECTIRAL